MLSLIAAGMDVRIDGEVAIAHNKVLIVDGVTVVSGSYNWTACAEKRNAENLFVLRDKKIAAIYRANWINRYNLSRLPKSYFKSR